MSTNRKSRTNYFWWRGRRYKYSCTLILGGRLYYILKDYKSWLKAFDKRLEKMCVIRFRSIERANRNRMELRLGQLGDLKHMGLPYIYDKGRYEDKEYIVLDWVPGKDLKYYLERSKPGKPYFHPERSHFLFCNLVKSLEKLHAFDVHHGDIKPENIIATTQIRLTLIDFGAAWSSGIGYDRNAADREYGAPEIRQDDPKVDSRADQFSASIVFYEMLTGYYPFEKGLRAPVIPPHKLNRHIGPGLSRVICTGLSLDPNHRYKTTEEWRKDLEKYRPADEQFSYNNTSIWEAWVHLKGALTEWFKSLRKTM